MLPVSNFLLVPHQFVYETQAYASPISVSSLAQLVFTIILCKYLIMNMITFRERA